MGILQRRYQLEEWSPFLFENSYRFHKAGPVSWDRPHWPEMLRDQYEDDFAECHETRFFAIRFNLWVAF